jgi:hypothetical protein
MARHYSFHATLWLAVAVILFIVLLAGHWYWEMR